MATIFDMLFGPGTGAVQPYAPTPAPARAASPYKDVVDRYKFSETLPANPILTLDWRGQTATGNYDFAPVIVPGGSPVTFATAKPVNKVVDGPVSYNPDSGEARTRRDITPPYNPYGTAAIPSKTAIGTVYQNPAVEAIEEAAPRPEKVAWAGSLPSLSGGHPITGYAPLYRAALVRPPGSLTDDGGFMQPEADPWAGMRNPAENARAAQQQQLPQQQRQNLLMTLLGGLLGGGQQPSASPLAALLSGGTSAATQASPYWLSATGQGPSNDSVNSGISGPLRYGGGGSLSS